MLPCKQMAIDIITNKIPHYHGAISPEIEIINNFQGREGFFIKKFLISDKFNANRWRVTWEAIIQDVHNFVGKPIVLTPNMDHPPVEIQEDYRVGEIISIEIDELNHKVYEYAEITNKAAQELIISGKIEFGSPTVVVYSDDTRDIINLGDGREETTLHRFKPAQDALVGNPAYGKEVDNIPAVCTGDGVGCATKLLTVSAEINSDNINQLTIVPFVKKAIAKKYSSNDLNDIVGKIKNAAQKDLDSCVEKKIQILSQENPTWDNSQLVATAFSSCEESKMEADFDLSALENMTNKENIIKANMAKLKKLVSKLY